MPTNAFANVATPLPFVGIVRTGVDPKMPLWWNETVAFGTGTPAPFSTVTLTVPRPRNVIGTLTSRPLCVTDAFVRPRLPDTSDATRM